MKVFLLELEIFPNQTRWHDGVVVGNWNYYDVFLSLEKAVSAGKAVILKKLKEIKKLTFKNTSIEDIAEDELSYIFCVYEFDPSDKRKRETWQFGGSKNFGSSKKWEEFTWWKFKYNGDLEEQCNWQEIGYLRFPGDEKEDAGTLFKVGDFVTITGIYGRPDKDETNYVVALGNEQNDIQAVTGRKGSYSDVCVVLGVPGNKNECKDPEKWENIYTVTFIDEQFLYDHTHPHESQIHLYNGEVPEDNPLWLLRKLATGEIEVSEEIRNDMFYRNILFDYKSKKSWKDIPEFND